jgi:hypothetical protein
MIRIKTRAAFVVAILLTATAALAYHYAASSDLFYNGSLVSSGVIQVKGVAYVPVKDFAKATNTVVTKTSRGYELGSAGGAGMVPGLEGKVGDELFNGIQRFKVIEVIRGKSYTNRFTGQKEVSTPYSDQNDLVTIICRLKNGTKDSLQLALPGGDLTALTDMNEHAYSPRSTTSSDFQDRNPKLLPGSACDFALNFDVPSGAVLKDLVYQVYDYDGSHKPKPFRVTLQGSN